MGTPDAVRAGREADERATRYAEAAKCLRVGGDTEGALKRFLETEVSALLDLTRELGYRRPVEPPLAACEKAALTPVCGMGEAPVNLRAEDTESMVLEELDAAPARQEVSNGD